MENKKSVFETLNAINVNDMVEKKKTEKSTLTYLSWSSAWQVVKEKFPDVEYEILRNPETNLPYWYDPLTGYMVFTKVTIGGSDSRDVATGDGRDQSCDESRTLRSSD